MIHSESVPNCLRFDNDISGIGVRIAIYTQNFFVFLPVLWNIRDGYISESELKSIEKQSIAILIIAFAILISTVVQVKAFAMTNYHAALVLDLSWMNNVCTFVWFMMYLHHKTKPTPLIPLSWNGWKDLVVKTWKTWGFKKAPLDVLSEPEKGTLGASIILDARPNATSHPATTETVTKPEPRLHDGPSKSRLVAQFLVEHLVLILGSFHLSLMAAVGIWLWSDPQHFGTTDLSCPVETVILGHPIPLSSPGLRAWSLLVYSVLLMPGLNLLLPFAVFLLPHIVYNRLWARYSKRLNQGLAAVQTLWKHLPRLFAAGNDLELLNSEESHAGFTYFGLLILFAINIIFLVNIETTITHNKRLQMESGRNADWGYGQILSLVLLVVPMQELLSALAFVDPYDRGIYTELLRRVGDVQHRQDLDKDRIRFYVQKGADVTARFPGGDHSTLLHRATARGERDMVEFLLQHGASVHAKDLSGRTALYDLCLFNGGVELAAFLLDKGADLDTQDNGGWTLLQMAADRNDPVLASLLIERGIDITKRNNHGVTALHHAAYLGSIDTIRVLLDAARQKLGIQGRSSASTTSFIDEAAFVNAQNMWEYTALHDASANSDSPELCRLLLEHGADPSIINQDGLTPAELARRRGGYEQANMIRAHVAGVGVNGRRTASSSVPIERDGMET